MNLPPEQESIRAKCFHPSGTFTEFPKEDAERSIPERFEKIVQRYPDNLAVKMGDRSLTYDELNRTANRIARALMDKRGAGNEAIALIFEHGIEIIAAILGVLKAGKFYVALDPMLPLERNGYILEDIDAAVVLTNDRNKDLASALIRPTCIALNIDQFDNSLSACDLNLAISQDDKTTVSYTSGSTGTPKGVIETHRLRPYDAMIYTNVLRICADDRLTLLHSLCFATGQTNLYQALLNGASLFLYDVRSEGIHALAKWLKEERITVLHLPVAAFRQFAGTVSSVDNFPDLRVIHISGAPITRLDFELYRRNFSDRTFLVIHMGATEAGAISMAVIDKSFSYPTDGAPAGYPLPAKKILLLDDNGHEIGAGESGEIAVKSRYLSQGYWKNPELTYAKFRSDPFGGEEQTYLTGDFGRVLPDGLLIHLGRKDLLLKIRGYRVDPSEIERALLKFSQVREAAVVAWDQEPGDRFLVGYVVPREASRITVSELNRFLRNRLPDYMIPSAFILMGSLPLTNGKLDRQILPKPDNKRPELNTTYTMPRSEIEKKLVQIWENVLDIQPVGVHDDFFDLGGHSLAATRVVSQVINQFQLELPLQVLFESPTVAEMAAVITEHQGNKLGEEELRRMLSEVEAMSDEEAQRRVSKSN